MSDRRFPVIPDGHKLYCYNCGAKLDKRNKIVNDPSGLDAEYRIQCWKCEMYTFFDED
jgi:hypothetical protein